jgi:hypothetical protein
MRYFKECFFEEPILVPKAKGMNNPIADCLIFQDTFR